MDASAEEFLVQIGRGPAVLLLGQRYLRLHSEKDPFLSQIAAKYGGGELSEYSDLLTLNLATDAETILAWMDERCRRIAPPDYLAELAEYPWSSVVTSAIDTLWPSAFRRPWRQVQPVFEERHRPIDPRNRARLHCLFLYSNVNGSVVASPHRSTPVQR